MQLMCINNIPVSVILESQAVKWESENVSLRREFLQEESSIQIFAVLSFFLKKHVNKPV